MITLLRGPTKKYENHGAQPVVTDNDLRCHAGCFAPVAPARVVSDLNRSVMKTHAFIFLVLVLLLTLHANGSEKKDASNEIDLLSPSSNAVWTKRLLRIHGMNHEEIAKLRKRNSEPYSAWLSYAITIEAAKSTSPEK